jgi:hypothetical protein
MKKKHTFVRNNNLNNISMKKVVFISIFALIGSLAFTQEQEEGISKGDTELSFNGFVFSTVGTDFGTTSGTIFVSYGYYITKNLLVGGAPGITISEEQELDPDTYELKEKIKVDLSLRFFATYNFMVDKRFVPYAGMAFYQNSVDIPEGGNFLDYSYIQFGGGAKYFLTNKAAWDSSLNFGFSPGPNAKGGMIMFLTGLTFLF